MNTRIEHDTMGEIAVPADRHWGAQTQRSVENFRIGGQRQPKEIITAFAYLKDACEIVTFAQRLAAQLLPPGSEHVRLTERQLAEVRQLAEETPLGRLGTGEDVARAAAFLLSSDASFITGQVLGVDGGYL